MDPLFLYLTLFIIILSIIFLSRRSKSPPPATDPIPESDPNPLPKTKDEPSKPSLKELKKLNAQSEKQQKAKSKRKVTNPEHPSFMSSFKGFSDEITDVAFSPSFVAVSCMDRTLKLFKLKQMAEENPFYYLLNMDVNYPTSVSFSGASESHLAVGLSQDRSVELFEFTPNDMNKKYFRSFKRFPNNIHKDSVKNVYYVNNGCIVTFGGGSDTTIKVWNSSCELLTTVDTKQVKHNCSACSLSKRFLMVGSWCPDVKVFEVKLEKTDKSFKGLGKIMDLGLHKTGIDYISCSQNEDKVVTISQDHTVRLWKINVEYEKQGDPKCLLMVDMRKNEYFPEGCDITAGDVASDKEGNGVLALAGRNNIALIRLGDWGLIDVIERAHSEDSVIRMVRFMEINGQVYLFSYGSGDCRVNVFKINLK